MAWVYLGEKDPFFLHHVQPVKLHWGSKLVVVVALLSSFPPIIYTVVTREAMLIMPVHSDGSDIHISRRFSPISWTWYHEGSVWKITTSLFTFCLGFPPIFLQLQHSCQLQCKENKLNHSHPIPEHSHLYSDKCNANKCRVIIISSPPHPHQWW